MARNHNVLLQTDVLRCGSTPGKNCDLDLVVTWIICYKTRPKKKISPAKKYAINMGQKKYTQLFYMNQKQCILIPCRISIY